MLLAISNNANEESGEAWPSMAKLAERARCSERTVQRCIERLVELGEIAVSPQAGGGPHWRGQPRHRPNLYTLTGYLGVTVCRPDGVTPEAERGDRRGDTGDENGVTLLSHEPTTEPGTPREPSPPSPPEVVPTFDDAWSVYPRKTGKGAAREKWDKATRTTPPIVIYEGVLRFARDPNLPIDEPQYIPHLATWLHQRRWEDGPLPPRRGNRMDRNLAAAQMFLNGGPNGQGRLDEGRDATGGRLPG